MENEAIQESRKVEMNALSERNKIELAALTKDKKVEMNALFEQNKMIQDKLNTMIQEKKRFKSAASLAGPKRAEAEAKAVQAKDDRMYNLMMKRK
jgi:hypothetical protein